MTVQNLINELVNDYIRSKYNKKYLEEKIKNLFREIIEKIDRPIVIYVASKFENNKYFGTKIIEEALKWK